MDPSPHRFHTPIQDRGHLDMFANPPGKGAGWAVYMRPGLIPRALQPYHLLPLHYPESPYNNATAAAAAADINRVHYFGRISVICGQSALP